MSFEDLVSAVRRDETDVDEVVILAKLSNRAQEVVAEVVPPEPEAFTGRDHVTSIKMESMEERRDPTVGHELHG